MVNSNIVNSKFHQFKGNLTGVLFEVVVIQTVILKFVVIQSFYSKFHVIQELLF